MRDQIRFLEADDCPMRSDGGWMVPLPATYIDAVEVHKALTNAGLVENKDFTILKWSNKLKRVMFMSDEAFILAKIVIV